MLICVLGDLGSGKTLFLTIMGYLSSKKVFSNYKITYPDKKTGAFSMRSLSSDKIKDAVVLIDEIYTLADARTSGSDLNRIMSYILFQSRKKNLDIFISSQLMRSVDVRYRELIDYVVYCENLGSKFKYTIMNSVGSVFVLYLSLDKADPFFSFYNTNEIVNSAKSERDANAFLSDDELKEIIQKVKKYLEKNEGKFTRLNREIIDYILMKELKLELPTNLIKKIFLEVKYNG